MRHVHCNGAKVITIAQIQFLVVFLFGMTVEDVLLSSGLSVFILQGPTTRFITITWCQQKE